MQRFLAISALALGMSLTGCATTQQVISKVQSPSTPLEQILKQRSDLVHELATVEFRQYFNNIENPTSAEVKVTQTALLDDSVAANRTTYHFKLMDHKWVQVGKKDEYRCVRGKNTKDFQTANCP